MLVKPAPRLNVSKFFKVLICDFLGDQKTKTSERKQYEERQNLSSEYTCAHLSIRKSRGLSSACAHHRSSNRRHPFGKVDISATSWLTRLSKLLILSECPDGHCIESRRPRSRVVTSSSDRRRSRLLRTSEFRGSK